MLETTIPLFDNRAIYGQYRDEMDEALREVLESGVYVLGPPVRALEREFADYSGVGHCLTTTSGTNAIHFALRALGIGPGDEVVTAANTCVSVGYAIEYTGAVPRFADIDAKTHNMDPASLEANLTPRTRAVLPIHMYGLPADIDAITSIARRHGAYVVEDAALAPGATYRGRRVGGLGDAGIVSFGQGKVLSGLGAGGAVLTNDDDVARMIDSLRSYGRDTTDGGLDARRPAAPSPPAVRLGYTGLLNTLQGAALRVRLKHLDEDLDRRRAVAQAYDRAFAGSPVATTHVSPGYQHVYRSYVIRVPEREQVQRSLLARGVETGLQYVPPIHLTPHYRRSLGYGEGAFPVTERVASELLCLPCYPTLSPEQATGIADLVLSAVASPA